MAKYDRYFDYTLKKWRQQAGDEPSQFDPIISDPSKPQEMPEYFNPETNRYQTTPYKAPEPPTPVVTPAQTEILKIDLGYAQILSNERENAKDRELKLGLAREQNALAAQELAANAAARSADAAYRSQALAQDAAQFQARMALDEKLAAMQERMGKLRAGLDASIATGYIPSGLAKELGIAGGPTLEAQDVAWKRFMDAYQIASNPRNLPGYLNLIEGVDPGSAAAQAAGAVPPFLAALAAGKVPTQPLTSGREQAISQNARTFTAGLLEKIPPMFTNEQLNPQAFAPVGFSDTPSEGGWFAANPLDQSPFIQALRGRSSARNPYQGSGVLAPEYAF